MREIMKFLKITAALLVTTAFATPASAQTQLLDFIEGIDVRSEASTVSEYVFRGQSRGAQSIISDSTFSLPIGLDIGYLYNAGIDPDSDVQRDEIRVYANYALPLSDAISADVGVTHYYYPQFGGLFETDDGSAGSYEFYGSAGLNEVFLKPKLTVFYDVTLENLTVEGAIGHTFVLPREGWTADLGLTGGYVSEDSSFVFGPGNVPGRAEDYGYATLTAGVDKIINKNIAFYADANFTFNSEDDSLNFERDSLPVPAVSVRDEETKFWIGTGLVLNF